MLSRNAWAFGKFRRFGPVSSPLPKKRIVRVGRKWHNKGPKGIRLFTIRYKNATSVTTYQTLKTGRQNINADYDVVAEAEAILAEAALATV